MTITATSHHSMRVNGYGQSFLLTAKQDAVRSCLTQYGSEGSHDEEWMTLYRNAVSHGECGWPQQSDSGLRTRRKELVRLGFVEATDTPGTNSNGNATTNWRIVPKLEVSV